MIKLTKDILIQYCDMQEEIKDIQGRIKKLNDQIDKIEKEGNVKDTVKGGSGGIQHFVIDGFPHPERNKKILKLNINKMKLEYAEWDLLELTNGVEEYIQAIADSRIRRIMRLRYIDNLPWVKVAKNISKSATEDSVRMEHNRYLEI